MLPCNKHINGAPGTDFHRRKPQNQIIQREKIIFMQANQGLPRAQARKPLIRLALTQNTISREKFEVGH